MTLLLIRALETIGASFICIGGGDRGYLGGGDLMPIIWRLIILANFALVIAVTLLARAGQ